MLGRGLGTAAGLAIVLIVAYRSDEKFSGLLSRRDCEWQLEWDDRVNFVENDLIQGSWSVDEVQSWIVNGSVLGVFEPASLLAKKFQNAAWGLSADKIFGGTPLPFTQSPICF